MSEVSLLERLRTQPDEAAWRRLIDLYAPFIRTWLRNHGADEADADELAQDVLAVLVRQFSLLGPNDPPGGFRSWLSTLTVTCLRIAWPSRRCRPLAPANHDLAVALDQLEDPASDLSRLWDLERDR